MKPAAVKTLVKLSRRAGVRINVEPRHGFVGQIVLKDGRKRYFRDTNFDLNTSGAYKIAKDKDYTAYFLRKMGYKTIPGRVFYSEKRAKEIGGKDVPSAGYLYAKKIGFPVIVKPNSLGRGTGVAKAHNRSEFFEAVRRITRDRSDTFLVQPFIEGKDYRLVVFDGRLVCAYERLPLTLLGDGRSSISILLEKKRLELRRRGRHVDLSAQEFGITRTLRRRKLSRRSILKKGERLELLSNRNLSSGGEAEDVTGKLHPSFARLAIRAARDMNLRLAGVDLMVKGDIQKPLRNYRIIEINASPGVEHYASMGPAERKVVDGLYLKILRALAK